MSYIYIYTNSIKIILSNGMNNRIYSSYQGTQFLNIKLIISSFFFFLFFFFDKKVQKDDDGPFYNLAKVSWLWLGHRAPSFKSVQMPIHHGKSLKQVFFLPPFPLIKPPHLYSLLTILLLIKHESISFSY